MVADPRSLLGNEEKIRALAEELQVPLESIEILDNFRSPLYERFVDVLSKSRARKGWSLEETRRQLRSRFVFGTMMVFEGHVGWTVLITSLVRQGLKVLFRPIEAGLGAHRVLR